MKQKQKKKERRTIKMFGNFDVTKKKMSQEELKKKSQTIGKHMNPKMFNAITKQASKKMADVIVAIANQTEDKTCEVTMADLGKLYGLNVEQAGAMFLVQGFSDMVITKALKNENIESCFFTDNKFIVVKK